ncbi:MAG: hypothetical protein J0I19_13465 [Alphaproteobacteria bacterium]|nr:hypothetical protein [Alphaproteobacteria bacterium]
MAVMVVGNTAWELEFKFNYRREPLKGQDPGQFAAYAVPLQSATGTDALLPLHVAAAVAGEGSPGAIYGMA